MENSTNHKSFILRPSKVEGGGVGVFILHSVQKGTLMEVFSKDFEEELCSPKDVPEELQGYCLGHKGGKILCPKYFNKMDVGNYLNHGGGEANLEWREGKGYFALRDIEKGEELLANYKELGEPKETHDDYY